MIRRFLRLPATDRGLLVAALPLLVALRLALLIVPFGSLRRLLARAARTPSRRPGSAERIAWAVQRVGRVPGLTTCLTQALAAQWMCLRRGIPSRLHIGVRKSPAGKLEAHAWMESGGRLLVGTGDIASYQPLLDLDGRELAR